jgi:hypothetical protein
MIMIIIDSISQCVDITISPIQEFDHRSFDNTSFIVRDIAPSFFLVLRWLPQDTLNSSDQEMNILVFSSNSACESWPSMSTTSFSLLPFV